MNDLFRQYQTPLLKIANNRFGRKFLGIDHEVKRDTKIVGLTPNAHIEETGKAFKKNGVWYKQHKWTFRTYPIFAKRLGVALNILDIARDNLKYRRLPEYAGLLNYAGLLEDNRFPDIYLVDYYPAVGTGGDSIDGQVIVSGAANWAAARDAATGDVDATGVYHNSLASKITASDWRVYHLYFTWPTQSIPDTDTIDSATASFFHTTDSLVDADNSNIYLVANNQFSATALQADDFVDLGAINLATAALDITGMTNAYQDMAIASGNLGQINKTAPTKLGLRVQMDVDNTEPTGNNAASFAMADGTAGDPKLTVVSSAVAINEAAWARHQEIPVGLLERIRTIPY